MAIPLIVNGVTFQYPQQFDKNWGPTLTNWSSAVTSGMLQKAGGTFTLTAETDFGASFGLKTLYIKTQESNIAATGILRLGNASAGIVWRNALNNADLALTVNASNQLTFNGTSIGATTSLTNGHILVGNVSNQPADVAMSGDITITNAGVTAIGAGKVLDATVGSAAAIALSKLAPTTNYAVYMANGSGVLSPFQLTGNILPVTDANGLLTSSGVTVAETLRLVGVTSAIQTQLNAKLNLAGGTMSANLNMGSNKIVSLTQGANSGEAVEYSQMNTAIAAAVLAGTKYFQCVQATGNTVSTISATVFTTTVITASITPSSSSHRIKVTVCAPWDYQTTGQGCATILRGSTELSGQAQGFATIASGGSIFGTLAMAYVDSPATTSSTTYTVSARCTAGSQQLRVGRADGVWVILLEEIV